MGDATGTIPIATIGQPPPPKGMGGGGERSGIPAQWLTTRIDHFVNWARGNSLWPLTYGTACCGIEVMSVLSSHYDLARFGAEVIRFSPRQADLLIVAGTVVDKLGPVLKTVYQQMPDPKWVIAMGACSSSMGVFNNYAIVPADKFMPVDVHVPGCPPRPEALMHGILKLQRQVQEKPDLGWRDRYQARGTEEVLRERRDA